MEKIQSTCLPKAPLTAVTDPKERFKEQAFIRMYRNYRKRKNTAHSPL